MLGLISNANKIEIPEINALKRPPPVTFRIWDGHTKKYKRRDEIEMYLYPTGPEEDGREPF